MLTYFPAVGFAGSETFTYAAWDGAHNSALATGTVSVAQGPYSLGIVTHVPTNAPAGWPVAFAVVPTVTNNSSPVTFNWNFGDGSAPDTNQFARHVYSGLAAAGIQAAAVSSGAYSWKVVATVGNVSVTNAGGITITAPAALAMVHPAKQSGSSQLSLSWPSSVPKCGR